MNNASIQSSILLRYTLSHASLPTNAKHMFHDDKVLCLNSHVILGDITTHVVVKF